jgi:hypothetical protein
MPGILSFTIPLPNSYSLQDIRSDPNYEMPGGIHAPLEVILTWPTPNYVNPTTRPNTIFVLACVCGPTTIVLLLGRLWVRSFHQRNPGWDDWLILAGTVRLITSGRHPAHHARYQPSL